MPQYRIPVETKEQILDRVKNGVSVAQLSREHGINRRTIYGWLCSKSFGSPNVLQFGRLKRERDDLLKLVGKLTLELSKEKKGH